METGFRNYKSEDFLRVRDFLTANYKRFKYPVNWDRFCWVYTRCFMAPMLGAWGLGDEAEKIPDTTGAKSEEAVRLWESSVGIWETDNGEIAGVVCPDEHVPWHPAFGQAFLHRHPDYNYLLPEMLEYTGKTFIGRNMTQIQAGEHNKLLQDAASRAGFVREEKPCKNHMEFDLSNIPEPNLPQGYRFVSMAENNDIEKRREVVGRSFYHPDPNDWATAYSYRKLQEAPDYRKELDIVVERPDGKWVACTIAWFDEFNRMGTLEPVGAIQLGMGREVVMEGLRRLRDLGAEIVHMDTGRKFYKVIGFEKKFEIYRWSKKHKTVD